MSVDKDDFLLEALPPPLLVLQKLPVMSVDKDDFLLEAVPPPLLVLQKLPVMSVDKDDFLLEAVPSLLLILQKVPVMSVEQERPPPRGCSFSTPHPSKVTCDVRRQGRPLPRGCSFSPPRPSSSSSHPSNSRSPVQITDFYMNRHQFPSFPFSNSVRGTVVSRLRIPPSPPPAFTNTCSPTNARLNPYNPLSFSQSIH
jgi:hypothetical protein